MLIARIMTDAESLIRGRLVGLLGHGTTPAAKVARTARCRFEDRYRHTPQSSGQGARTRRSGQRMLNLPVIVFEIRRMDFSVTECGTHANATIRPQAERLERECGAFLQHKRGKF